MDSEPEVTIGDGRYAIAGVLGRGGMAEVRKAQDLRLGRTVAIKRLRADLASDPTFQARFRREAQSAASLNHPTVVAVYDTGEEMSTDGSGVPLPYIVMEYVEGRTLRDILQEGRRILPERALEITASVLTALDYSHRAGIIHRDIKPANVMLTPAGDVKVMDFGIARAIADSSTSMTQTAAVVGTAQYLSPEQARGEQVDARSDLYSTGCLLFELLTSRPPFVGDSPVSVAYQHVREEADAPSTIDHEISPAIDAITMKALAKPVDERYQSATEMRADIERALEGRSVMAPPVVADAGAETEHFLPPHSAAAVPTTVSREVAEEEDTPRRRTGLWVALLLLAALVIAALVVVPNLLADEPTAQAQVPKLIRLTEAEAERDLEDAGLVLGDTTPVRSDAVPKGQIVSQSEPEGELVDEGTAIDIELSAGTAKEVVQDVSEMNLGEATDVLEEIGFAVNPVEDEESIERLNEVTRTDPAPGTTLRVGETVDVYYSTGFVDVPSVIGETEQEATRILDSAGFRALSSQVESDTPEGTVTAQDPEPNSKRPLGDTVTIDVSLGPQETTAPPTTTPTETTPTETTPTETTPTETTPTETTPTKTTPTETTPTETTPTETTPTETTPTKTTPTETSAAP